MSAPFFREMRFESLRVDLPNGPTVFEDFTLTLPLGKFVRLEGQLGSGKSTLLRVMVGLQEPSAGRFLINGTDVCPMSFEEFNPYRRAMGYCFEYGGLLGNRTIRQNLMLPFFYHQSLTAQEAERRVAQYLDQFGLVDVKDQRPAEVSGGQRKACCLARAMIVEPELLILDNPLMGLNLRVRETFGSLLKDQRAHGRLKHVFVAGDDDAFYAAFQPVTLSMRDVRQEGAA